MSERTSHSNPHTLAGFGPIAWAAFAAAMFYLTCVVTAQAPAKPLKLPHTPTQVIEMTVDAVGDAHVTATTTFDASTDLDVPSLPPVAQVIADNLGDRDAPGLWARLAGLREHWFKLEDIELKVDPTAKQYVVEYAIRGFARRTTKSWELRIADEPKALRKVGNTLSYDLDVDTELGKLARSVKIVVPDGSVGTLVDNPYGFHYTFKEPELKPNPARHTADLQLDAAPQLMGCLAKCYGYDKFPALWVGRTRFTNTGDSVVTDYRVRFRLTDFSTDWTPWYRTAKVLPGQTVVDPYFPVLDIEKVGRIEGKRQCTLEIEYEYHLADGKVVKDSDGRKLELAGKNERLTSDSIDAPFSLTVHYTMLCAAFVSKDDPVIRMAAGRISGQVKGGIAPLLYPEDAIEFLRQTHRFVIHNKITYQTPPVNALMQHHKYGREVLQNRSGTCVDLADLYASLCEAVGLEVYLVLPPGHCLVKAKLPPVSLTPDETALAKGDEKLIAAMLEQKRVRFHQANPYLQRVGDTFFCAVETTMLAPGTTFDAAATRGFEYLTDTKAPPKIVDINLLRFRGIQPLELPEVPANVLESWGVTPAPEAGVAPGKPVDLPLAGGAKRLVGNWRTDFTVGGQAYHVDSTFNADGTMTASIIDARGVVLASGGGAWKLDDNGNYTLTGAVNEEATITWPDADSFSYTVKRSNNPAAIVGKPAINRRRK